MTLRVASSCASARRFRSRARFSRWMTRRTTLTLAAAVATFGAAMGMRAPGAWAQGKTEGKEEGKAAGKMEGKGEGKADGKREGKGEGKGEGKMEGKREGKADGKMEGKGEGKMEARWRVRPKARCSLQPRSTVARAAASARSSEVFFGSQCHAVQGHAC
jgi:hypothetical protein